MTEVAVRVPVVEAERKFHIVDTDVHERAELPALVPYLAPMWQKYITDFGWVPERNLPYAQFAAGGLDRADAKLPDGRPGGSDLGLLRRQLLDEYDIDFAILTGWLDASALHPGWPEFKTALMTAYNDWQIESWLESGPKSAFTSRNLLTEKCSAWSVFSRIPLPTSCRAWGG